MFRLFCTTLLLLSAHPIFAGPSQGGLRHEAKKYFLGFGDYLSGEMDREVAYDLKHIHGIFTSAKGGNYSGTLLHGANITGSDVRAYWASLKKQATEEDLFIQYSSGLGAATGLGIGLSFDEIRDRILELPARQIIVFTMSDYSGRLIDSFNQKKNVWKNWPAQGRALLVMSSTGTNGSSTTGPGTDPGEPSGIEGSAGSAFGWTLWKALNGKADGFGTGIKDGYVSIKELVDFTKATCERLFGQEPLVTGSYDENTILAQDPSGKRNGSAAASGDREILAPALQ